MKLTTTEKLFLSAHRHNWDEGTGPLKKILAHPDCDLGTALLIYWRARPEYYRQWPVAEVPRDRAFEIVQLVEDAIVAGRYRPLIRFDPREEVGLYDDQPKLRELPPIVYQPSEGSIPAADLIEGRRGEGAFVTAAKTGDLTLVQKLLDEGMEIDVKERQMTALDTAAAYGQLEAVEFLLSKGANPKLKRPEDGYSAIHHAVTWPGAARAEHALAIIDRLLAVGVKVDQPAKWKRTPLHKAADLGRTDVADHLIARGAKKDLRYRYGETALHLAALRGATTVVELLLAAGWDLQALDDKRRNALHHAVEFPGWNWIDTVDRGTVVELLLARGIDLGARDDEGLTPPERARKSLESNYLGQREKDAIVRLLHLD